MEDINGFFSWGMDVLDPSGTPSAWVMQFTTDGWLMVG